jgi:hypothetical protein
VIETAHEHITDIVNVIDLAAFAVEKALTETTAPDFGPYGIGRLPNDLDGYPDPNKALEAHVDFSIYADGEYPAYILASRPASCQIAC